MKRGAFLSLTATSAAALTARPSLSDTAVDVAQTGGIAPQRINRSGDFVIGAESFSEGRDRASGELRCTATPVVLIFGSTADMRATGDAERRKWVAQQR